MALTKCDRTKRSNKFRASKEKNKRRQQLFDAVSRMRANGESTTTINTLKNTYKNVCLYPPETLIEGLSVHAIVTTKPGNRLRLCEVWYKGGIVCYIVDSERSPFKIQRTDIVAFAEMTK